MALFKCCIAPKGPAKTVPLEQVSPTKVTSAVEKQGCLVSLQFADQRNAAASETGVLIGPNLVLTSHDTLSSKEQASRGEIQVVVSSGGEYLESRRLLPERVFLTDPEYDVTIVSCESTQGLQGIKALALEEALHVPEASIAVGSSVTIFGRPADVADLEGDRLAVVKGQGKIKAVDGPFLKFASNGEPWAPGSAAFDEQGRFMFLVCGPTEALNSASPRGKKSGAKAKKGGLQSGTTARAIIHWVGEQGFKDLRDLLTASTNQPAVSETVLPSDKPGEAVLQDGTKSSKAAVEMDDPSRSEGEPLSLILPEERENEEGFLEILEPNPAETSAVKKLLDEPAAEKQQNEASVERVASLEAIPSIEAEAMIAEASNLAHESSTNCDVESAADNAHDGHLTSVNATVGDGTAQETSEATGGESPLAAEEKCAEEDKQTEEQNKEAPTVEAENAAESKVGQAESNTASVTESDKVQSSLGLETNLKPVFVSRIPRPPSLKIGGSSSLTSNGRNGDSSPRSNGRNSPRSKAAFLSSSAKPGAYVSEKEAKLIKHLQKQAKRVAANDGSSVKEAVDEIERRTSSTEKALTPEESSKADSQSGDKVVSKDVPSVKQAEKALTPEATAKAELQSGDKVVSSVKQEVDGTGNEKATKADSHENGELVEAEEATFQQAASVTKSPGTAEQEDAKTPVGDQNEAMESEKRKEESKGEGQNAESATINAADETGTEAKQSIQTDARDQADSGAIIAQDQLESERMDAYNKAESRTAEANGTEESRAETENGELPIGEERLLQFSMSVAAAKESFEKLAKKETKKLSKQGSLGSQRGRATTRSSSRSADERARGSSRSADERTRGNGSLDTSPISDEKSKSKKTIALGGKKPSLKPPPGLAWKSRAAERKSSTTEERKMSPSNSMKKNGVILGRGLVPYRSIDSKERTRSRGLSSQKAERTLSVSDIDLDSDTETETEAAETEKAETETEMERELADEVGSENGKVAVEQEASESKQAASNSESEAPNVPAETTAEEKGLGAEELSVIGSLKEDAETINSSLNQNAEATASLSDDTAQETASSLTPAPEMIASSSNENVEATARSEEESTFTASQQHVDREEAGGENVVRPEASLEAPADVNNEGGESSADVTQASDASADVIQKDAAKGDLESAPKTSNDETAPIRRHRNSMPASMHKGIEASALLAGNKIEGFGRQTIDAPKPRARTTEDKVRNAQERLRTNVPVLGPVLGLGLEVGLRLEKKLKREEDLHGLKKASKFKVKKAAPTIVVPGQTTGQEVGGLPPQERGREIRPGVYESAAQSPTSPADAASPKFIPEVLVKVTQDISRGVKVVTDGVKAVTELPGIKEGLGIILEPIKKLEEEKKEAERKRLAEVAAKERAAQEEKQGRLDRLKVNDSNTAMRDIRTSILGLDFGKKKRRLPGSEDPDLDALDTVDPEARAVHRANLERRILGSFSGLLASTETLTQMTTSEVAKNDDRKREHEAGHVSHLWPGHVPAAGSWEKVPPRLHKYVRKTGEMTLQQQAELLWHASQEAASDPYERLAGEEPDAAERVSKGLGDQSAVPPAAHEATKQVTKWQDEYWQARMAGFRHENAW